MKTVIILAGGLGTRLRSVVQDIPKPMAPVKGKPFVEYIVQYLKIYGIQHVIFSIGYRGEIVQNYFGNNFNGVEISYAVETTPLGTGGGIYQAMQLSTDEYTLVVNGDTLFDINLFELEDFYLKHQPAMAIALRRMKDFNRYGVVELADNQRVIGFKEKQYQAEGLINGGVYIITPQIFAVEKFPEKFSFEKDLMEKYLYDLTIFGCELDGYFIDIGIPEDYARAEREL
ncbi:MAG: nucleotidyltransferase family protein [Bacteroidota bacterium]